MSKELTPKECLQGMLGACLFALLLWGVAAITNGIWHTLALIVAVFFAVIVLAAFVNYLQSVWRRWRASEKVPRMRQDGTVYDQETGEVLNDGRSSYLDAWDDTLAPLWQGSFETTFSYRSSAKQERTRRTVTVTSIVRDHKDALYLQGFCHLRNEERTFSLDRITTKLTLDGKKHDALKYIQDKIDSAASQQKQVETEAPPESPSVAASPESELSPQFGLIRIAGTDEVPVYFKYQTPEDDYWRKVNLTVREVARDKDGGFFLLGKCAKSLAAFDMRHAVSDIYIDDAYRNLPSFLLCDLRLSPNDCGFDTLWEGAMDVALTTDNTIGTRRKKMPFHLVGIYRSSLWDLCFCGHNGDEQHEVIPAADVVTVFTDAGHSGVKKFLGQHLGLEA